MRNYNIFFFRNKIFVNNVIFDCYKLIEKGFCWKRFYRREKLFGLEVLGGDIIVGFGYFFKR